MPRTLTTLFKEEAVASEQEPLLHLITVSINQDTDLTVVAYNDDVQYNGITYTKFPVKYNGMEINGDGSISKANVVVANADRTIQSFIENYNGLRNCPISIKTVFAKFLDKVYNTGWYFDNTANGWGGFGATLTTDPYGVIVTSTSTDPMFYITGLSVTGSVYKNVKVRVKRLAGSGWQGTLYYHTAGHGASESYKKDFAEPENFSNTIEITLDMSQLTAGGSDWATSVIDSLRFDFGTTTEDVFQVEYVALIDDYNNIFPIPNVNVSTTSFTEEFYVIDSYTATESAVQFNLEPSMDFSVRLPRRRFTHLCYWRYKSAECGYVGALSTCKKDITDCEAHSNVARFGGFVGVPASGVRRILF